MSTRRPYASEDDALSTILMNGADVTRRRLYLCGEIEETSAYRLIVALQTIDETDGPITLVMNTCGGLCEEGFAIYDTIKFARNDVYIVGFGQVASMGTIIMQAGDKRLLSTECDFMIHDVLVTSTDGMSLQQVNTLNKNLQRMQDRGNRILSAGSGQGLNQIKGWCREETTFSAQEAVQAGFADSILRRLETKKGVRK